MKSPERKQGGSGILPLTHIGFTGGYCLFKDKSMGYGLEQEQRRGLDSAIERKSGWKPLPPWKFHSRWFSSNVFS